MKSDHNRPQIMIIDDDHSYRHVIDKILTAKLLAEVSTYPTADDARSALELAGYKPDLIILDLELPGTLGQEFLKELKAHQEWRNLPVLVMTGNGSTQLQVDMLLQGADDFVEKGESAAVLVARIGSQLRHKWARDHLTKIASESDLFAAEVLDKIEVHLDDLTAIVDQAQNAVQQKAQPALEQNLADLRKAGECLGRFTKSILR